MKKFLLISLLMLLGISSHAESLDINTLLNKMVAAYGGEEALKKAGSYTQEWEVTAMMSGEKGVDRRKVTLPDTLYIDLNYPSRSETRILKEGQGIKITNQTNKRVAQGPMLDAMKLQLMRLYTPTMLQQHASSMQINTQKEFYILRLPQGSIVTDYYVDAKSFRITKVIGTLSMGGNIMSFVTQYSDFKMVEGVLVPHHEVKYAGNVNTAVLTLKSMRYITVEEPEPLPKPASI